MSLQQRLAFADRILALGEDDITRHRHIVARLERDGCETRIARHVLETFEYIQAERLAMRNEFLAAAALKGMRLEAISSS
jgi:hypothetical protein